MSIETDDLSDEMKSLLRNQTEYSHDVAAYRFDGFGVVVIANDGDEHYTQHIHKPEEIDALIDKLSAAKRKAWPGVLTRPLEEG